MSGIIATGSALAMGWKDACQGKRQATKSLAALSRNIGVYLDTVSGEELLHTWASADHTVPLRVRRRRRPLKHEVVDKSRRETQGSNRVEPERSPIRKR